MRKTNFPGSDSALEDTLQKSTKEWRSSMKAAAWRSASNADSTKKTSTSLGCLELTAETTMCTSTSNAINFGLMITAACSNWKHQRNHTVVEDGPGDDPDDPGHESGVALVLPVAYEDGGKHQLHEAGDGDGDAAQRAAALQGTGAEAEALQHGRRHLRIV